MSKFIDSIAMLMAFCMAAPAFAARPLAAISTDDPDHSYYKAAIDLDQSYWARNLIRFYAEYDSSELFRSTVDSMSVTGRVVAFLDGQPRNPANVVISVNGVLYYVNTGLARMQEKFSLVRRWEKDNPGIFLIVRGARAGALRSELVPVKIMIRIATARGELLPVLGYSEEHGLR